MEPIQIVGIKDLDDMEIDAINRIANRYYPKIERSLKGEIGVTIHVKSIHKQGTQKKYDIHVKARAPKETFVSTKGIDWDINKALRMSFEDILHRIEHTSHEEPKWTQKEHKGRK